MTYSKFCKNILISLQLYIKGRIQSLVLLKFPQMEQLQLPTFMQIWQEDMQILRVIEAYCAASSAKQRQTIAASSKTLHF